MGRKFKGSQSLSSASSDVSRNRENSGAKNNDETLAFFSDNEEEANKETKERVASNAEVEYPKSEKGDQDQLQGAGTEAADTEDATAEKGRKNPSDYLYFQEIEQQFHLIIMGMCTPAF